ncbi:MAG: hypothetical protein JWM60_1655 [Solirubrobacterales bacterium]|nr:hypothetical protein [Solirubrobacterales bacterium]
MTRVAAGLRLPGQHEDERPRARRAGHPLRGSHLDRREDRPRQEHQPPGSGHDAATGRARGADGTRRSRDPRQARSKPRHPLCHRKWDRDGRRGGAAARSGGREDARDAPAGRRAHPRSRRTARTSRRPPPVGPPRPMRPPSLVDQPVGRFAAATRHLGGLRKVALDDAATDRRSPVAALSDRTVEIVTANLGMTSMQIAGEIRISEGLLARVLTRLEREGRLLRCGGGHRCSGRHA